MGTGHRKLDTWNQTDFVKVSKLMSLAAGLKLDFYHTSVRWWILFPGGDAKTWRVRFAFPIPLRSGAAAGE